MYGRASAHHVTAKRQALASRDPEFQQIPTVLVLSDPLLPVLYSYKELLARLIALEIIVLPTALLLLVLSTRIDDEELRPELVVRRVVVLLVVNTPVYPLNITKPLTRRSQTTVIITSRSCSNIGDKLPWAINIVKTVRLRSKGVVT